MAAKTSSKSGGFERFVPILLVISIVLAFAVGVLWQKVSGLEKGTVKTQATAQAQAQKLPEVSLETIKGLFGKDTIKFGSADSKLILVEVSDASCPYCHIAGGKDPELIRDLVAQNPQMAQFKLVSDGGAYVPPVPEFKKLIDAGKASFVYIYTPGHGNGEMGAKALYCAYDAGKFWEVHDLLMSDKGYNLLNNDVKNDKAKSGVLADFLASAMDKTQMKDCLDSGKFDANVTSDVALASSLGVTGTPGFFINSTNFAGAYSYTDMKPVVDAALK